MVQLSHPFMTTRKTIILTRQTFISKVMSLLFNILSRLVIAFLPRRKHLLISWLQSPSRVILEPKKVKSLSFHCFLIYFHEVMGPDAMTLVFWMLRFKPAFSLSSFTFIKRLLSSSEKAMAPHSVLLPEESQGPGSLVGCRLWGRTESDTTEATQQQQPPQFLFTFCHKGGLICISEVIAISPGNLDSSLCFIQPGMSHDVLWI